MKSLLILTSFVELRRSIEESKTLLSLSLSLSLSFFEQTHAKNTMVPLPVWLPCPVPPLPRRQHMQMLQRGQYDASVAARASAPTSPLLARAGATATVVGRFIYVIGGRTG